MPAILLSLLSRAWPYLLIVALGGGLYVYHLRLVVAQDAAAQAVAAREQVEATLAGVQADKARSDALLASREADAARREAGLAAKLTKLKGVKTDACIDTAVPDDADRLLRNAVGAGDDPADTAGRAARAASGAAVERGKLPGLGGLLPASSGRGGGM